MNLRKTIAEPTFTTSSNKPEADDVQRPPACLIYFIPHQEAAPHTRRYTVIHREAAP